MIERHLEIPFVAELALREKQIQQSYRPVISIHKWFARRPGTLFRALLLSEFVDKPLQDAFYESNDLRGVRIADPFMGGGTPLLEANRLGCDVIGYDINPMAYWIVKEAIEHLDLDAYRRASESLRCELAEQVGELYRTRCVKCGSDKAHVKYFLWVKVQRCRRCGAEIALFPRYLVAKNRRHPLHVLVCPQCGGIAEVADPNRPGTCSQCGSALRVQGPARRSQCTCPSCRAVCSFPDAALGPPDHRLFALEYHCFQCKPQHKGRFFKSPDAEDLSRFDTARRRWSKTDPVFVPKQEIPTGDETDRLHRWGYRHYREMFNVRQLLGLEVSCEIIRRQADQRIRNALATNLSDLLRYQNMLCRYDAMALKSLDVFSVHGFPVGLIQCESNLLGICHPETGSNIGSGGWSNIIAKFVRAKSYCQRPFEIRHYGRRKVTVPVKGEWIGDSRDGRTKADRVVDISRANAVRKALPPRSLDGVFTDPPYFRNVQYAELMDFCYVWLRRLVGSGLQAFSSTSTRNADELTGNEDMGRGLEEFTDGLSRVFRRVSEALRQGAPLVFTYHHNDVEAYYPVGVAVLDAGLTCSASLPCPAEMAASIHISGTRSSIVDTVFVCRSTGRVRAKWLAGSPEALAEVAEEDLQKLRAGTVRPTAGDLRCVIQGHLLRLAIWSLREGWNRTVPVGERLALVGDWIADFGGLQAVLDCLDGSLGILPRFQGTTAREPEAYYEATHAEVSF